MAVSGAGHIKQWACDGSDFSLDLWSQGMLVMECKVLKVIWDMTVDYEQLPFKSE